ncbi:PhoH-like protein [Lasiodiplodia theobromae]|uniref:PhoH-like protein n=1 Tax=Lasiodiplodia theobromae TaxID=45133 RepID=UPI0015C3517C|nr:PhoH-like protein [Lasiodiplodia theobromae]KAF4539237.1 PhoH-like protein [Lasiodiplodia theobromae]
MAGEKGLKGNRYTLSSAIDPQSQKWEYTVAKFPPVTATNAAGLTKCVSFISNPSRQEAVLRLEAVPQNRITKSDPLDRFMFLSFSDFRLVRPSQTDPSKMEQVPARETADYISRILKSGIRFNGVHYNFYGHSNSQLKTRSCVLFADTRAAIHRKIESLGDFSKMTTVGKKAKRIGLLFSSAEMGVELAPERCEDIPDVEANDYVFTDGCGLISTHLARLLVESVHIAFRNHKYIPSVFQIRYRGYKGVLSLDPSMGTQCLAKFRSSMKKFRGGDDLTLSVVDYSKPYTFGYLNDEVVLLLHALGVPDEVFLRKQAEHLSFLESATRLDVRMCFRFLSYCNRLDLAERLLISGVETVEKEVRKLVGQEYERMLTKRNEQRCRILIPQSRLLFGVCDPKGLLKEGECAVRVTMDGDGQAQTIVGTQVLVTRNPCLHPGDLQKFKAVFYPELSHLVDCVVFPTQGKRPSADLMSGGDLDGDKFFVCWDKDLIPAVVSRPAEYPGPKAPVALKPITEDDRIDYFAQYSNMSLGRVKNLFLAWARLHGPLSPQCQQLNRLFSLCVDGDRIKVPQDLQDPPKGPVPSPGLIVDRLHEQASAFIQRSLPSPSMYHGYSSDAVELISSRDELAISEFELVTLTYNWCLQQKVEMMQFLPFFDLNKLTDEQKAWVLSRVPPTLESAGLVMNSLNQSNLLQSQELRRFGLDNPGLHWKCVYDSSIDRLGTFFNSASRTLELFHKKLIILRIDERLSVAIFIPQKIEKSTEFQVDGLVRVFSFPHSKESSNAARRVIPTKVNYRLYCDDNIFQLYENRRAQTWIFLTRGALDDSTYRNVKDRGDRRRVKQASIDTGTNYECRASIDLGRMGRDIQRHMGRINRAGIEGAEIYVISNRDTSSLRQLDLWLELVDTQDVIPLFQQTPREYTVPHLNGVDWTSEPTFIVDIARDGKLASMGKLTKAEELWVLFRWLARFDQRVRLLQIYNWLSTPDHYGQVNIDVLEVAQVMLRFLCECPFLTGPYFRSDIWLSHKESLSEECSTTLPSLLKELILSSELMESFVKEPFMTALDCMTEMTFQLFGELVETISLSVHSADLAMELLFELQARAHHLLSGTTRAVERFTKSLLGIALDHIGEAISDAKVQNALVDVTRVPGKGDGTFIECRLRIDQQTAVLRVGDHVQLVAASPPSNATLDRRYSMDVLVEGSERGKAKMRCIHHPPPFLEECSWKIKKCGSFVTSKTMLDAVVELYREREICSILYQPMTETGPTTGLPTLKLSAGSRTPDDTSLNESQLAAVSAALSHPLCLLWGPPGTGKTRTIVAILIQLLLSDHTGRVLVTAPTHNAVDNVLRKFIELHGIDRTQTAPLRVSTDVAKVSEDLRPYTCDAMMGKDINEHFDARKKAAKRIKEARLIFTTCIGAGLGLLRGESFDTVLVDEASQQTEPASLVPLTKGCKHAVLVGDHVQLRATVQMQSLVADFDVSLFESLYAAPDAPGLAKVMIDVQYRMHKQICAFSSKEFYQGRLETAVRDDARPLPKSAFAWPTTLQTTGQPARMVLIPCAAPEDIGQKSKSNRGQALLCREVCSQLLSFSPGSTPAASMTVAVLTPYSRQRELLKQMLPKSDMLEISSIDGYQGREADVVVFVTTRCNVHGQLGFLSDMRRLNVTMTRAKAGVVIIGHKETLCGGAESDMPSKQTWGRLLASCQEMTIETQK